MKITKAVIPAAGFGTRFLPITKAQPKEMIPIVDTPVIQYVVEEAVESGITDILLIIGRGKRAVEEHFDRSFELENILSEKNFSFAIPLLLKIWFVFVPCGCRAPEINFTDLEKRFADNLPQFRKCAQAKTSKKLESFMSGGPQPGCCWR